MGPEGSFRDSITLNGCTNLKNNEEEGEGTGGKADGEKVKRVG